MNQNGPGMNATPTIDPAKLTGITLARGGHQSPDEGLCLLEAVAFLAGERHSDNPACTSRVLGEMGRGLNDVLPDDLRQQLLPLIPALPGTAGDGHDETRSYMALDWLIRTWLPTWLELAPACREDAARVRELGRIVDLASAERAGPVVRQASEHARAAGAAAGAAAWAAGAAAGDAARDAAWDAARAAAGAAARDAAWAAAGAATGAAWAAARDAAWAAAWDAAAAAAGDAAWDAARDHLQPTVTQLQQSVIDLFSKMAKGPFDAIAPGAPSVEPCTGTWPGSAV